MGIIPYKVTQVGRTKKSDFVHKVTLFLNLSNNFDVPSLTCSGPLDLGFYNKNMKIQKPPYHGYWRFFTTRFDQVSIGEERNMAKTVLRMCKSSGRLTKARPPARAVTPRQPNWLVDLNKMHELTHKQTHDLAPLPSDRPVRCLLIFAEAL